MTHATRLGDWAQTATGRQFWPIDPRPEDVDPLDIAIALSKICRFGGHLQGLTFYSVAQHCCHISDACPEEYKLWGLMHDASEAYLGDKIRPLKPYLVGYKEIEDRVMAAICDRMGLAHEQPAIVKQLDCGILHNEKALLAPHPAPWTIYADAIPDLVIEPWSIERSWREFMMRLGKLWQPVQRVIDGQPIFECTLCGSLGKTISDIAHEDYCTRRFDNA